MLGIEDVASYSDFFSPEEWVAIQTGDWWPVPVEDWGGSTPKEQVSSGVAVYGPDCAAQRDQVAPEDPSAARAKRHSVSVITQRVPESKEQGYELGCNGCGHLSVADTFREAQAIACLHEQFVAVLMDRWDLS
jgi:hypothetical protein